MEGIELARFVRENHRSGLEIDHYVDNPLARIEELERRLADLERFALSGLFESGGTTMIPPGDIDTDYDVRAGGFVGISDAGELTISSGEITATGSYHSVDTESDAASDDLDTINGSDEAGDLLVLRAENSARTVVVKDGTGNLRLAGGDFSLDHAEDRIVLQYDGTNWVEIGRANNS